MLDSFTRNEIGRRTTRVPNGRHNTAVADSLYPKGGVVNLALMSWLMGLKLRAQHTALVQIMWGVAITGIALLVGVRLYSNPDPVILATMLYLLGAAVILYQPRYGIYFILFLGLVGDTILIPWFPFVKNLSSPESLFFIHTSLIFSPLEIYIVLTLLSWLGRKLGPRQLNLYTGPLFRPMLIFMGFVVFGLVHGLATGGDLNIGLFEARPIFYLAVMLILVTNLIEKRDHVSHLLWVVMTALFIESIAGVYHILVELQGSLRFVEAITEHAAAVHMNTLFVFAAAVWLYKGSTTKRIALPLMIPTVLMTYVATQRRAAFLALGLAFLLMAFVLYKENRRAFWLIVPPLMVMGVVYLGAFWNAGGALGKPAQSVKSVIAPNQLHLRDQLSNVYRVLENVNVLYTIKAAPLTGVGFGNKFYIVIPMPDISFFTFWEYLPHNSMLWTWIKMGIGGFLAMIYLVGTAIMVSVRAWLRMPGGDLSAAALTITLYLIMHFLYGYVDISWDIQSMLYVGAAMGLANSLERIVAQPLPLPARRWPWQPKPKRQPGLRPLADI